MTDNPNCQHCGKEFLRSRNDPRHRFCSAKCQTNNWAREKRANLELVTTTCEVCNSEFQTKPHNLQGKVAQTCDIECATILSAYKKQVFTDEELIKLMYLNKGCGMTNFIKEIGMRDVGDRVLDIIEFVKDRDGVDLYTHLQSPDEMVNAGVVEYQKLTGKKQAPKGQGRNPGSNASLRQSKKLPAHAQRQVKFVSKPFNWGGMQTYEERTQSED